MLASLQACPQLNEWSVHLWAQAWPHEDFMRAWKFESRIANTVRSERFSVYQSRVLSLPDMGPDDVMCFGDDDMLFLPQTDYDTPAAFLQRHADVGVVSTAFKQFPAQPGPDTPQVYSESPLIGVMGGMLINYESGLLVRDFGDTPQGKDYAPDDIHIGAACYVAGKMNYHYHGSLCVHSWGMPGGVIVDQRAHPWEFRGHPDYFQPNLHKKYKAGKQFKLDYTERAHAEHAANARKWAL
jgi:hypothetical protein